MRRATMGTNWLLSPTGEVLGLSLGSDACTEHECGIKGLRDAFGTPTRFENGIADRTATQQPPALGYHTYVTSEGLPAAWLVVGNSRNTSFAQAKEFPAYMKQEASLLNLKPSAGSPSANTMSCAWDEDGALIHVRTTEQVERLSALHKAILAGDIAFGGDLVDRETYGRIGGLIFVRPSQVPETIKEAVLAKDQSGVRLREAAAATGISEELRAAGKRWFALSPRWKDAQESEVVFWLNPMEQSDHHAGQFNVSQLRQWAANEGPVMIDKPLRALAAKHSKALDEVANNMRRAGFDVPSLHIIWKDEQKSGPAVRATYYGDNKENKPRLEGEVFDLSDLKDRFPKPAPKPRKLKGPG